MSEKLYYIYGNWITYEEAHNLGYSLSPQRLVSLYTANNESLSVKQDAGDSTYYDSSNNVWVTDFADIHLYKKILPSRYYRGESFAEYDCYISSVYENVATDILYNGSIVSLDDAYDNYGITSHQCTNIITYGDNIPVVWYNSVTSKYFDDRDGHHEWVNALDCVKVTSYNSFSNVSTDIYESTVSDEFYINGEFVSKIDFYNNDSNGIIREVTFTYNNDAVLATYYDSYSNEYCIPNVTQTWVTAQTITDLGYIFVDGTANLWLCQNKLHLAWVNNTL